MLDKSKIKRYLLQAILVSGLVTLVIFLLTLSERTFEGIRSINLHVIPIMFLLAGFSWFCNGMRTWLLANGLGYRITIRQSLVITMSTEFGIAASPGGFGGSIVRLSFMKEAGIPYLQGISIMATDLSFDFLFFMILSPIALIIFLVNYPQILSNLNLDYGNTLIIASLGVLFISGLIYYLWKKKIFLKLWKKIRDDLYKAYSIIKFFLEKRRIVLVLNFIFMMLQWISRYSILPLIMISLSQKAYPLTLFLFQVVIFTLAVVIILPGGSGGVEVLTTAFLSFLIPFHLVGIVLLLWRFFTYYLNLIFCGIIFMIALNNTRKVFQKAY